MVYSDVTPDVTYTYDRLGRIDTVLDAAGTRSYDYQEGALASENHTAISYFPNYVISYPVDALGRPQGITVNDGTSDIYTATYGYHGTGAGEDGSGRLRSVSLNGHTHTYAYHANSSLRNTTTSHNGTSDVLVATYDWDKLNRLTSQWSGSLDRFALGFR